MGILQQDRIWTPNRQSGIAKSSAESFNPDLWRGLKAAWMPCFGVTGQAVRDVSGRHLATDASTAWTQSRYGHALSYDNAVIHEFTSTKGIVDWSKAFTVSIIARPENSSDDQRAISCWDVLSDVSVRSWQIWYDIGGSNVGWAFVWIHTDGNKIFGVNTASGGNGQWSIITAGWDGASSYFFVDGRRITESSTSGTPLFPNPSATTAITIGGNKSGTSNAQKYRGNIAAAVVWDRWVGGLVDPREPFVLRPERLYFPSGAAPPTLSIPIAAYHYNHSLRT